MFAFIRIRDWLPLALAAMLIVVCFLMPAGDIAVKPAGAEAALEFPVLIIDAGHGGEDGGASAPGGALESAINLAVAQKLDALAGLFGIETVMTRESEAIDYPAEAETTAQRKRADQSERLELINSVPNGVLVSIHQNFYPDSRPSGPQVFYADTAESAELGELTHANLLSALAPSSRRVAAPVSDDIYLMREARCTAILAECGFLSNPEESALLETDEYQMKIASVLMASYLQFFSRGDKTVT